MKKKTYKDLYAYNMNIYIAYKYNAKITHYLFTQTKLITYLHYLEL